MCAGGGGDVEATSKAQRLRLPLYLREMLPISKVLWGLCGSRIKLRFHSKQVKLLVSHWGPLAMYLKISQIEYLF